MIACNVEEHRELVGWMNRTLMASRKSEGIGKFMMRGVFHLCGSPMCMAGHGIVELKGIADIDYAMIRCRKNLGFPISGNEKIFKLYKAKKISDKQFEMLYKDGDWWFSSMLSNEEAFRRWEMTLNYRRRQLAQLEVDAGEWGRSKRAKDMPVGIEREAKVKELSYA